MKKNIKKIFHDKKVLFAHWRSEDVNDSPYHLWYLPLKKIFDNILIFDPAINYFRYGREKMENDFLDMVKKEKPDYILFSLVYDEFSLNFLNNLKNTFPNIILINLFNDDDWRFFDFTRYYIPFFDYITSNITDDKVSDYYKKERINNVSFFIGVNCDLFKPLKIKKKYDVTFFGRPNSSRVEFLSFLVDNKINIRIWGDGWAKYPKLSPYYEGFLPVNKLAQIINESKINLSFTQGGYGKLQRKGRQFEAGACKSFTLVEYYDNYLEYFEEDKEIVMFKDKKELLNKINYYLSNEKDREIIAKSNYKKIIKDFNQDKKIENFLINFYKFDKINKDFFYKKKVFQLTKSDFEDLDLNEKLKNIDYISFSKDGVKFDEKKDKLQVYGLEKSKKEVSFCDYYLSSDFIGNYLLFKTSLAFNKLKKSEFISYLDITQLMVSKKFFFDNIEKIRSFFEGNNPDFIDKNNIEFLSIPLVQIYNIPKNLLNIKSDNLKEAFQLKFIDKIYSLYYNKKLFNSFYIYLLLLRAFFEPSILKGLYFNINDKSRWYKFKKGI